MVQTQECINLRALVLICTLVKKGFQAMDKELVPTFHLCKNGALKGGDPLMGQETFLKQLLQGLEVAQHKFGRGSIFWLWVQVLPQLSNHILLLWQGKDMHSKWSTLSFSVTTLMEKVTRSCKNLIRIPYSYKILGILTRKIDLMKNLYDLIQIL